ncbi:MAG: CaiB/BaiF CoA-transferase family protein [Burkholderiaceae bacterium]
MSTAETGAQVLPLAGLTVIALEQAVAAPYCSSRLADMGARVIKIERADGDFARGYDRAVHGEASYFVWINRGKESIALDVKQADDLALLRRMIGEADIFLQNLAPGAVTRLGLDPAELRDAHPRLITCSISGYGESGPAREQKAYDLLVQAESGLVAVNGAPGDWGRIGVSICDINAGMNAIIGILQAVLVRQVTGRGAPVDVSLFGTAAELMSVPYLQGRYGGKAPERVGLRHPTVAPYGVFRCADQREVLISIQNEREWVAFCKVFMQDPAFATDARFASNPARCANREALDARIGERFAQLAHGEALAQLRAANTAYGSINRVDELITHPQLQTVPMTVHEGTAQIPAVPYHTPWSPTRFGPVPGIDEHGPGLRAEFGDD